MITTTKMVSGTETTLIWGLTIIQASLLHPHFKNSKRSRTLRALLGLINATWWISYPFRLQLPSIDSQRANYAHSDTRSSKGAVLGFFSFFMTLRTLEWAFITGPYYIRNMKRSPTNNEPVWEKEPIPDPQILQKKEHPESSRQSENFNLAEWVLWTYLLLISQRGYRWSWGATGKANTRSFGGTIIKLIRLQSILLISLGVLLKYRDQQGLSPNGLNPRIMSDLLIERLSHLRSLSSRVLDLLGMSLYSINFMLLLSSWIEMLSTILIATTYPIHNLIKFYNLLPSNLNDRLFNPENYPKQFNSLFDLRSLSYFWGKSWHQKFRRIFMSCGLYPALILSTALGAPPNVQKYCGFIGAFATSGIFHEFAVLIARRSKGGSPADQQTRRYPRSLIFFLIQAIGIMIERIIFSKLRTKHDTLNKILRKIWTASFLLISSPLFVNDFCFEVDLLATYDYLRSPDHHFIDWSWFNLLVPIPIAPYFT